VFDKRGDNDPSGTLYLTSSRAIFRSLDGLTITKWAKVVSAERDGRTVSIQRLDRQTPYLFDCKTFGDAMKAEFIAKKMLPEPHS
jgi:hypothetical protein